MDTRQGLFDKKSIGDIDQANAKHTRRHIRALLQRNVEVSPQQYADIQCDQVFGNLFHILTQTYPIVQRCIGNELFKGLAFKYVMQNHKKAVTIGRYGESFPTYISAFEPLSQLPYLSELARLEWHWNQAFHAKDEAEFNASAIVRSVGKERNHLVLHAYESMSLLASMYPLSKIWKKYRADPQLKEIELQGEGELLLIWRDQNQQMRIDHLNALEFTVIKKIKKSIPLGTIVDSLQSKFPDEQIDQVFSKAVTHRWISRVTFPTIK